MLKKTDALHRDHESLCEALRQTSSVAMQINEGIRDRESRSRIIALQNRFSGDVQLVAPSRRLARIGPLTKVCRARNQQYESVAISIALSRAPSMFSCWSLLPGLSCLTTCSSTRVRSRAALLPSSCTAGCRYVLYYGAILGHG